MGNFYSRAKEQMDKKAYIADKKHIAVPEVLDKNSFISLDRNTFINKLYNCQKCILIYSIILSNSFLKL